jgi:PAS domain S-box-containing protein
MMDTAQISILIIEDNEGDLRLITEMLKESASVPFDFSKAELIKDAEKLLSMKRFDIAILDLNLPDSYGFEGLEKITSLRPGLPVIVLTGIEDEAVGLEAVHKHASDFLVKGQINSALLVKSIRYAIERKRFEELIRHAKEDWERTFDTVPDLIAVLDKEHRVVRVNKAMAARLGLTPKEAVGKHCYEVVHGTTKPPDICPHALTCQDNREHSAELFEPRLDGDFLVTTTPMCNVDGTLIGSIHVARDITARKRQEEELNKLNRTLRALSDSNHALMLAENEIDYINKVCRIVINDCGYSLVWVGYAEDDKSKTVKPVGQAGFEKGYLETLNISWADTERGRGPTGTAIRTAQPAICRNMLTDPNFKPWRAEAVKRGYMSSLVLPLMLNDAVFGAMSIYSQKPDPFSDDEVKLLKELADDLSSGILAVRTSNLLKVSEEKFRVLAEALPQIVWSAGADGAVDYYNRQAYAYTGVKPGDINGWKWESVIHPEDIEPTLRIWKNALDTGHDYMIEHRLRRVDKQYRWHLTRGVAVRSDMGQPLRWIGTDTDIHDQKQAEEILKRDKKMLEQIINEKSKEMISIQLEVERGKRLADIGTLAATVAHELRNPLATIRLAAYNVKKKIDDPALQKRLNTIDQKVLESDQIINNLLFYSRLKYPQVEKLRLYDMLNDVCETACVNNAKKQFTLNRKFSSIKDEIIEADPLQLKELFANILNNACDAVSDKGGVIDVTAKSHRNKWVEIEITDNGVGIDKENMERLLEPFFSTKSKGTGLGLTVCQQIIKLHDGNIAFASEKGKGTKVTIKLPFKRTNSLPKA